MLVTTRSRSAARLAGHRAKAIAAAIDKHGYARLTDVLSPEWLADARAAVASHLPAEGVYELFVDHFDGGSGSSIDRLIADQRLTDLFRAAAAVDHDGLGDDEELEHLLRIVTGTGHAPLDFHYDSTVLTAVVPIVMPDGGPGRSGELILDPHRRPYRRTVLGNAVDKLRTRPVDPAAATRVPLRPGDLYLFWGYRTFHTTLPIPPGSRRITLVLHFGRVHRGATMRGAKSVARSVRGWRRRRAGGPQYRLIDAAA
ncbi:hypothetical protein LV457_06835 [Mycobacterium sp. MYCO198283]|uniref:hypothetical protein n=1 Tax=Mycobacterium sp. MYCO198283 TaxID=2883505 RepID=UPI001E612E0D|nr:hypothetical protein [Mycobacterium sp. MYCO198283]MCG5432006.1 hypothetical protein [Mycobacterium sp. MYCO198283]